MSEKKKKRVSKCDEKLPEFLFEERLTFPIKMDLERALA